MTVLIHKRFGEKILFKHLDLSRFDFEGFQTPKFGVLTRNEMGFVSVSAVSSFYNTNMKCFDTHPIHEKSTSRTIKEWAGIHQKTG